MPPLGESGGSVQLEVVSGIEVSLLVEVVADRGMNGGEFLQTSYAPEPEHGTFPPSKREMRILGTIVNPAASFLPIYATDLLERRTV